MAKSLYVEIVAPDQAAFRGDAARFSAPGVEGGFEVLPNHAAMVAATAIGTVTITLPDGDRVTFAVSEGFVEVLDNRVIMVVETAEPADAIDLERAKAAEERAKERIAASQTPEERAAAEADRERARNRARAAMAQVGAR